MLLAGAIGVGTLPPRDLGQCAGRSPALRSRPTPSGSIPHGAGEPAQSRGDCVTLGRTKRTSRGPLHLHAAAESRSTRLPPTKADRGPRSLPKWGAERGENWGDGAATSSLGGGSSSGASRPLGNDQAGRRTGRWAILTPNAQAARKDQSPEETGMQEACSGGFRRAQQCNPGSAGQQQQQQQQQQQELPQQGMERSMEVKDQGPGIEWTRVTAGPMRRHRTGLGRPLEPTSRVSGGAPAQGSAEPPLGTGTAGQDSVATQSQDPRGINGAGFTAERVTGRDYLRQPGTREHHREEKEGASKSGSWQGDRNEGEGEGEAKSEAKIEAKSKGVSEGVQSWEAAIRQYLHLRQLSGQSPVLRPALQRAIAECSRAGRWQAARDLLLDAEGEGDVGGTPTTRVMYCDAIDACAKARRPREALALLGRMEQRGIGGDVPAYTAAVTACAGVGQWEGALWVLRRMEQQGVAPNVVTWSSVVSACAVAGRADVAEEVLLRMRQAGMPPNVVTLTALIRAHGKAGSWQRAEEVMGGMLRDGPQPNAMTWSSLISAHADARDWGRALATLRRMQALGFTPSLGCWNSTLLACANAMPGLRTRAARRQGKEALQGLFQEMVLAQCKPSVVTFGTLIKGFGAAGDVAGAEGALEALLAGGHRVNSAICCSMLRVYAHARDMDKALAFFQRMRGSGLVPDKFAYTALIWGAGFSGRWQLAEEVFELMERTGAVPDGVVYRTLITTYEKNGQFEKAMQTLEKMKGLPRQRPEREQPRLIEY